MQKATVDVSAWAVGRNHLPGALRPTRRNSVQTAPHPLEHSTTALVLPIISGGPRHQPAARPYDPSPAPQVRAEANRSVPAEQFACAAHCKTPYTPAYAADRSSWPCALRLFISDCTSS